MRKQFWIIILLAVILLPAVGQAQSSDNPRSTGRIGQRKNIKLNNDPKESYTMFGVVLGTPGGINLLWGLQDKILGVRLSGGVIFGPCDVAAGFQTNFVYNLQKSKYFEQSLSIGIGLSDGFPSFSEAVYYGVFYSGNAFGLFAEIGIVTTIRGFPTPHVIGHLGYVWRFN